MPQTIIDNLMETVEELLGKERFQLYREAAFRQYYAGSHYSIHPIQFEEYERYFLIEQVLKGDRK